jgi:hypothetical protein
MLSLPQIKLSNSRLSSAYGLIVILSAAGYVLFFSLSRKHFLDITTVYFTLFGIFLLLHKIIKALPEQIHMSWLNKFDGKLIAILLAGLIFRFAILFEVPNLSQDFFRFIWDGQQLLGGFNPYLYLPDDIIKSGVDHIAYAAVLHENMGNLSATNYTNYPPLNQLFFAAASYLGGESLVNIMVWMRLMIIAADIGIFLVGIKLLRFLKLPITNIGLYFLNPFVIIELMGNLHWEGMMAFFLLSAIYLLFRNQWFSSAVSLASGVLVKLLPIIAIPVFFKTIGLKKWLLYGILVSIIIALGFLPFVSAELVDKYSNSVGMWFGKFEFNASIYYLIRWVGYQITGYNIIQTAGKILPLLTVIGVLCMSAFRANEKPKTLLITLVFSYCLYLFLSTTVHPWYLTIPLLLSVFTRYRFLLLWSLLVFLSYSAYSNENFQENLWLVAIEYIAVIGFLIYEIKSISQREHKSIRIIP